MKKVVILLLAFFVFVGCKKQNLFITSEQVTNISSASSVLISLNIDPSHNYLIFDSVKSLKDYSDFLLTSTHGEVQTYLRAAKFNSLGTYMFSEVDTSTIVNAEQASFYALNLDGVIQVQEIVMRSVSPNSTVNQWDFLLTIPADLMDSGSYQDLKAGVFSSSVMNKFAVGSADREIDLFSTISTTSNGYEEVDPIYPPSSEEARFLGWGWKTMYTLLRSNGDCIEEVAFERYTIFGIWTGGERERVVSSVCS